MAAAAAGLPCAGEAARPPIVPPPLLRGDCAGRPPLLRPSEPPLPPAPGSSGNCARRNQAEQGRAGRLQQATLGAQLAQGSICTAPHPHDRTTDRPLCCRHGVSPHLASVGGSLVRAGARLRLLAKAGVKTRAVHAAATPEIRVSKVSLLVAQLIRGPRLGVGGVGEWGRDWGWVGGWWWWGGVASLECHPWRAQRKQQGGAPLASAPHSRRQAESTAWPGLARRMLAHSTAQCQRGGSSQTLPRTPRSSVPALWWGVARRHSRRSRRARRRSRRARHRTRLPARQHTRLLGCRPQGRHTCPPACPAGRPCLQGKDEGQARVAQPPTAAASRHTHVALLRRHAHHQGSTPCTASPALPPPGPPGA